MPRCPRCVSTRICMPRLPLGRGAKPRWRPFKHPAGSSPTRPSWRRQSDCIKQEIRPKGLAWQTRRDERSGERWGDRLCLIVGRRRVAPPNFLLPDPCSRSPPRWSAPSSLPRLRLPLRPRRPQPALRHRRLHPLHLPRRKQRRPPRKLPRRRLPRHRTRPRSCRRCRPPPRNRRSSAYGTNFNVPGMFGEFPSKFPDGQVKYFYLDLERRIAEFAPGIEIPLAPFPGTLGVARAEPGQYSSVPPGRYGGNMDIRDLTEGAALYVPVFVKGALLWTGDSHAAQGNGEINLTALETAYKEMSVTVEVLKNMKLEWPRIETRNSWITVGIDRDLNKALDILKNETTNFLMEQRQIGRDQAEKLMMAAWDCRVSQVVDVNKGLHCFNAKNTKEHRRIEALPDKEDKHYLVTVGKDADLNKAMDDASWAMIELLQSEKKLSRLDAYGLASMVMDCRLAAPGEGMKAVHCLVPKSTWVASR